MTRKIIRSLCGITACRRRQTPNIYKRMYLPDCFHPFPFPNARLARCVYVSVWATVGGSVCDFFQTGDWKWGRSHYAGRITQSTPKWGAGACQHAWLCVCLCVCVLAGSSRWPSSNEPPMIYLLCPYPTSPSIHGHMISSISVIR